jgi:opacity protein-like surface antigen
MKKNLFFIAALFVASSVSAQFYAGLSAGYALGADKQVLGVETTSTSDINLYGSFGNGMNINLKLGYNFTDNLGFELGANYLLGSAQSILKNTTTTAEAKSSGLRLSPQLTFRLENGLYSRMGLVVPVMGKTVSDVNVAYTGVEVKKVYESKGAFSVGFIGAIGYSYKLSDNLSVFGELEYLSLTIKQGTKTLTEYTYNGTDMMSTQTISDKETEYVDEVKATDNSSDDEPTKELASRAPFSSIGINIGVMMSF